MPSSPDLASRLNSADAGRLDAALRQAWSLLEAHHPGLAAEIAAAVTVIVPLTDNPGGQASASSMATFGAIAMSVPADQYTGAETLAHEMQHLKLSALLDIVTLTLPDDGQRFYAPWRPDPRPIGGLLQGAYAFLGVSGFWRRQRRLADGALPASGGDRVRPLAGAAAAGRRDAPLQRAAYSGRAGLRRRHGADSRHLARRAGRGGARWPWRAMRPSCT